MLKEFVAFIKQYYNLLVNASLNLQIAGKCVPLHCVFHSIRFKVNKGWSKALLLFLWTILRSTSAVQFRYPIDRTTEKNPCNSYFLSVTV